MGISLVLSLGFSILLFFILPTALTSLVKKTITSNVLVLNIIEGKEHIHEIHERLYTDQLEEYKKGCPYVPHLTLGNLDSIDKLNRAYLDVSICDETFKAVINTISVEIIGPQGESLIISEHKLSE